MAMFRESEEMCSCCPLWESNNLPLTRAALRGKQQSNHLQVGRWMEWESERESYRLIDCIRFPVAANGKKLLFHLAASFRILTGRIKATKIWQCSCLSSIHLLYKSLIQASIQQVVVSQLSLALSAWWIEASCLCVSKYVLKMRAKQAKWHLK